MIHGFLFIKAKRVFDTVNRRKFYLRNRVLRVWRSKRSSYIFNYQQQENHCIVLKSNVWDIVNKIFLELAKTKCSSLFDSSSEMWEYSFLVSFKLPFIHAIPIDLILFSSPPICPLRLPFQCKIARLSSSNLKTHEVIICPEFYELKVI